MKKKKDDNWYRVIWLVIIGIVFFMFLKQRAENPISPFVLIIGIVGAILSGYLFWKLITEKNTEEQPHFKQKLKYTSIALIVCIITTLLGYSTMSISPLDFSKREVNKNYENDRNNEEDKALLEKPTAPENTPVPSADNEAPQTEKDVLIGTTKENVRRLLSEYKETKSIMSDNALDFENKDLLITVYFNSNDIVDGVLFMQNSFDGVDTSTGVGSYVNSHYDELVKLATDDPNVKVESDLTLYNSKGVKKEAMEIYIGNIPNMSNTSVSPQNEYSEKTAEPTVAATPEFKEIVFLNVGLKVYKYKSDSSYIGTIKIVDKDYKDERGKKVGAVYLEGGEVEGWYKREDIHRCFARSDDPFLNYSYE